MKYSNYGDKVIFITSAVDCLDLEAVILGINVTY